jgi:hypothetical protein
MRQPDVPTDGLTTTMADEAARAVQGGLVSWADLEWRLAPSCVRAEPRPRALGALRARLSPAERKHSWQLAEVSGKPTP